MIKINFFKIQKFDKVTILQLVELTDDNLMLSSILQINPMKTCAAESAYIVCRFKSLLSFWSEAFLARTIILFYLTKVNANFKQVLLNSTEIGCMQMCSLKHPFLNYAQLLTIHIPL